MAFSKNKNFKYKNNNTPKKSVPKKKFDNKKYNSPSFVLKRIESAIEVALTSNKTSLIYGKLFEAQKYINELKHLEEMGIYRGKTKSKDYVSTFLNRKDKIIIDGIKRCYENGETLDQIMESSKYFSDEVMEFVKTLE